MKSIVYILNPDRNNYTGFRFQYELHFKNGIWRALCFEHYPDRYTENRKIDFDLVKKLFKSYKVKKVYIDKQLNLEVISAWE